MLGPPALVGGIATEGDALLCAELSAPVVLGVSVVMPGAASFTPTRTARLRNTSASTTVTADRFGFTCDVASAAEPVPPGEGPASGEMEPRDDSVPVSA